MGAQGLQTILEPIQAILNDPQLSTEFIRLMKKAEAKAGQQQMQTNDIHNESVQFDEVVDYDLIENIFEQYHSEVTEVDKDESVEEWFQGQNDVILNGDEFYETFGWVGYDDESIEEAEYQGRTVKLNKPMRGDVKKFKVYVKNPKGSTVKVNFGDPDMKIKRSIPARRKSFRARHNCDSPGPKTKARYWSCKKW
jgi:hypothetical protein